MAVDGSDCTLRAKCVWWDVVLRPPGGKLSLDDLRTDPNASLT
jgi:hypothetical protein